MNRTLQRVFALTVLAALVISLGCSKKSGDSQQSSEPPKGDPKKQANTGGGVFKTDPVAWRADFAKDGKGTYEKYKGGSIEISGVVGYVNDKEIKIKAEGQWMVTCETAQPRPWLKVTPGSKVKLKGKLPDAISYHDPHLSQCEILEAGVKPASITAVQLTKEYLADRKAAKDKYHEKHAIVEGDITFTNVFGSDMTIKLKGEPDSSINCSIAKAGLENAQIGQKIRIFGQLTVVDVGAGKEIYMSASGSMLVK
jgi:tRNA_anti-like